MHFLSPFRSCHAFDFRRRHDQGSRDILSSAVKTWPTKTSLNSFKNNGNNTIQNNCQ